MLTCVIPCLYPEQPVADQIAEVLGQAGVPREVLVLNVCGGAAPTEAAGVRVIPAHPENLAALGNLAMHESHGDALCILLPNLSLELGALEFLFDAVYTRPRSALAYGPYWAGETLHPVLEDIGDTTEQRDTGWLRVYRRDALEDAGGWDGTFDHAADYDMHLRLAPNWGSVAVGRPLYRCVPREDAPREVPVGRSTLRLPGAAKHSVFSYLHYGPEQEREVERAFERWLRRRGAWLDAPAGGAYDPAAEGDRPLVSVVIPCRNRVRFVRMAVESALAQTYDPLEVLLIDNGSGDGSPESVEEIGDPRVRVIRNDGTTISSALNRGVREARGAFVAQLDSDDLYVPHTVEAAVACLKGHPRAGLAVSYYECIDPDGRPLPELGVVKHLEYNRNNILRCNGAGAVRVWRKGVVLELGGFDEGPLANYGEDYDLLLKLGERYEVERIHDVLYRYRRHAGNTDAVRDPLDNIRLKTLARHRALRRRTGRTTPT